MLKISDIQSDEEQIEILRRLTELEASVEGLQQALADKETPKIGKPLLTLGESNSAIKAKKSSSPFKQILDKLKKQSKENKKMMKELEKSLK